jgi:hypothetical protein
MCLGDNEKCSSKMREMCVVKKKRFIDVVVEWELFVVENSRRIRNVVVEWEMCGVEDSMRMRSVVIEGWRIDVWKGDIYRGGRGKEVLISWL